jgi:chromosomal replication initiator protein
MPETQLTADGVWVASIERVKENRQLVPVCGLLTALSAGDELAGAVLRVAVGQFGFDQLKKRPEAKVEVSRCVSEVLGFDCEVAFFVNKERAEEIISLRPTPNKPTPESGQLDQVPAVPKPERRRSAYLPESMGSFIVRDRNRLAFGMGMVLLGDDTPTCRLFFNGGPATGKTHLAIELCHIREKSHPGEVVYVSGWDYMNMFHCAARSRDFSKFDELNDLIAQASLVVLDDVHVLFEKPGKVQDQIRTAYNQLSPDVRLLLIGNVVPDKWVFKHDDLKSRVCGLGVVNFPEPDFELRLAVTEERAKELGLPFDSDTLALVAGRSDLDLRCLDGLLRSMSAAFRTGVATTGDLVADFLRENFGLEGLKPSEQIELVVRTVIAVTTRSDNEARIDECLKALKSAGRTKDLTQIRHLAIYVLCKVFPMITVGAAAVFFNRDRTTAINSIKYVTSFLNDDGHWPELPEYIAEIKRRLQPSSVPQGTMGPE